VGDTTEARVLVLFQDGPLYPDPYSYEYRTYLADTRRGTVLIGKRPDGDGRAA
jgi:hypothetical protein